MWKYMIHPNVLPLLGITTDPFQLVSAWMSGGDLSQYTRLHPDADRLRLVCTRYIACLPRLLQLRCMKLRKAYSTYIPATSSTVISRESVFLLNSFRSRIDTRQAKHPRG